MAGAYLRLAGNQGTFLIEDLKDTNSLSSALQALGTLGRNAEEAVPLIVGLMESREHAPNALRALKGIGGGADAAVPALVKIMGVERNLGAIEALMAIGPKAKPALPALQELLQSGNPLVRVLASVAIARIAGDYDVVVPVLVQELNNPANPVVHWHVQSTPSRDFGSLAFNHRQTAAWFLGELGAPAGDAVPELVQALRSQDGWLNVLAARAIWRINRDSKAILPLLIEALDVRDEHRFVLAVQAL